MIYTDDFDSVRERKEGKDALTVPERPLGLLGVMENALPQQKVSTWKRRHSPCSFLPNLCTKQCPDRDLPSPSLNRCPELLPLPCSSPGQQLVVSRGRQRALMSSSRFSIIFTNGMGNTHSSVRCFQTQDRLRSRPCIRKAGRCVGVTVDFVSLSGRDGRSFSPNNKAKPCNGSCL